MPSATPPRSPILGSVSSAAAPARPAAPAPEPTAEMPPPVRRPSVLESQGQRDNNQRRGSAVWPIAAVLVLGGAVAGGWAFREKIPFLNTLGNGGATVVASTDAPATSSPAASATPAPVATPTAPAPQPVAVATAPVPVDPNAAAVPPPVAPATTEPVAVANVETQPDPRAGIAGVQDPAGEAPADAEALGPLRRMAETRKDELARVKNILARRR